MVLFGLGCSGGQGGRPPSFPCQHLLFSFCSLEYFPSKASLFLLRKKIHQLFVFLFCHRYCPQIPFSKWLDAVWCWPPTRSSMLQSATETTSLYRVSPLGAGRITRSSKQPHLTDPNSVSAPASPGSALIIFPNTNATLLLVERWHLLRTDGSSLSVSAHVISLESLIVKPT